MSDELHESTGPGLTDLLGKTSVEDASDRYRLLAEGIAGYRIRRPLGRGGEGAVYEADSPDGGRVALKVVFLDGTATERVERVRSSFEALRRLDHPGVVRARSIVKESDSFVAVAMDFVEGDALTEHVATGEHRVRRAIEACAAVGRVLEYCHERGVLHRDVKPQNILVRPSGEPVLVDFGSARDARRPSFTESFHVKGTIGFIAPEQFMPGSRIDGRTDVFALGMTLHVLLTKRCRPAGSSADGALLENACREALREAAPEDRAIDPARLARAILRATELEAERRFSGAGSFAAELEAILRGEPLVADCLRPDDAPLARRSGRMRSMARAAAFAVLLIGLGGGVGYLATRAPEPREGWHGERMPEGLRRAEAPGEYVFERDGSRLTYVPAGTLRMGSDEGEPDERPVHDVPIAAFYLDKHEVTWSDWQRSGFLFADPPPWGIRANHPVVNVSWDQAAKYLERVQKRFPTEVEWEYAARGPEGRSYPWGDAWRADAANFCDRSCPERYGWKDAAADDGFAYTAPAGSFPAGASWCGALDLAGNVSEWCADWYDPRAYERRAKGVASETGPAAAGRHYRVRRGGAWNGDRGMLRGAARGKSLPGDGHSTIGFRGALSAVSW